MRALLECRGVSLDQGPRRVLDGVDLAVGPGELVGLVGPNGAGKTTLLRLVTRVLPPGAGAIHFGGRPLEAWGRRELARRVALVPQETGVPFPFTAGEVVLMGRAPHQPRLGLDSSSDVDRARRALARLSIEALADRAVPTLSGGERQLVLLARALAQDPALLLLDEPTAFLDLRHRIRALQAVRDRVDSGHSALVVSHDLGLVARVVDRLVLLSGGRVVASGAPSQVLQGPALQEAFGIEVDLVEAPEGGVVVVPRLGPGGAGEGSPHREGSGKAG